MERACDRCGVRYGARSQRSRFCSNRCRTAAQRARAAGGAERIAPVADLPPPEAGGVEVATRARLEVAERLDTPAGAGALAAARLVDSAHTPPSAVPGLLRELRAQLEVALEGAAREPTIVDELKARRERRRA